MSARANHRPNTLPIQGRAHDVNNAENCFSTLSTSFEAVEDAESTVEDLTRQLKRAQGHLQNRRDEFDAIRARTLEFCPVLEGGYGKAALTETVAIVDGKVTVVPIEQSGRPRADAAYPSDERSA